MDGHRFSGELVLLGTRVTRLPTAEEVSTLRVKYQRYVAIETVMPQEYDVITFSSRGKVEWVVTRTGQPLDECDNMACYLERLPGFEQDEHFTQQLTLRIAFDESAWSHKWSECLNSAQVMHDQVQIVGQVQKVCSWVRVPALPPELTAQLKKE